MITKVSKNEVLSRGQNQSISFANNAPSNTTGAANRKKNKMQNNQAVPADKFAKNHVKAQGPSDSSNNAGVLLGSLGLLAGGAALVLSLRKPGKASGALHNVTENGKPETTIHKALKELSESYEHHFKAPGDQDFTTMLQYQKDVALETRLQNYMTEALKTKKLTQHEANIGKLPDEVRAGITALKLEAFNGIKIKKPSGEEVKAGEYIQKLASEKIYAPSVKPMGAPRNGEKHVIWMPTAEDYKITKHGGLADVPPQLAEAIAGNDLARPVIISPMYKDEGTFVRRFSDGSEVKYSAESFKQITAKDDTRYGSDLEKLMEFKMDVFTGNKNEKRKINMEVFQAIEKIKAEDGSEKEIKRILLSTDNSFDACYTYNEPVEEKERFGAIFSKGVYEFRKLVEDFNTKSIKDVTTPFKNDEDNRKLLAKKLDDLKPDATILNDWHVAPLTALYKIKAPLEAARKDLAPEAAAAMMDQNISIIVHNGAYIGDSSGVNTAKILNTLFGDDTTGIVENATIKWADGVTGESDNVFVLQDKSDKTKNKYSSLLQVGLAYADVAIPVSRNYAKEIASAVTPTIKGTGRAEETTTNIKTLLAERFKHNTMIGVVNGFDSKVARLTPEKIQKLEKFQIGGKDYAIKGYKPYDYSKEANMEQNLKIKDENKQVFIDWLHGKLKDGNIRLHGKPEYSDISDINRDNIKDIPIIFMGSRVASQKGFGVAKDAIKNLMNGYSQKYPGKQKPLVIIGGPTQDDSVKFLKELKEELKEDGKRVLAVDGILPNDVIFQAADIKMGPSIFEPCGLVQQQAEAALNIPAFSKVGGHVDTIQDSVTGIVEPLENYAEKALPRALNVLFDADKRKSMLYKGMQEDFNWAQKAEDGKLKGPAIEHLQLLGLDSEKWVPMNKVNSQLTEKA